MLAEWSAACGADDPAMVVPWSGPSDSGGTVCFLDLRAEPFDLAEVAEAEQYPSLRRALRSLNATRSPVFTSKCDVWTLSPEEGGEKLESLRLELDLDDDNVAFGLSSYIDILWRERSVFASAHIASERLARLTRRAARLPHNEAAFEAILRPAVVDTRAPLEGFGASLYVTAVAGDPETALRRWEAALDSLVALLREREQAVPPGSATID